MSFLIIEEEYMCQHDSLPGGSDAREEREGASQMFSRSSRWLLKTSGQYGGIFLVLILISDT